MSLAKKFKTDSRCEVEGIELDYGDGVRIWIARAGGANKNFLKTAQRIFKKYRRQIQLEILDNDTQERLTREIYAETIVLRWEGITREDIGGEGDELVEFNRENCIALFENLPDLFADVMKNAQNAELFRDHVRENDAKN